MTGRLEPETERARWAAVYRKRPQFVCRDIAGEAVVVPVAGKVADLDRIYCMEGVGRFIFELVDGHRTLSDILDAVLDRFEVRREQAAEDLLEFVERLRAAGLIEESSSG